MVERRVPTQEERASFVKAVPQLLQNKSIFMENSQIVRVGSRDLLLSTRIPGKDQLTTSTYKLENGKFELLNSIIDGGAIKNGIIVTPLVREHFAPLED